MNNDLHRDRISNKSKIRECAIETQILVEEVGSQRRTLLTGDSTTNLIDRRRLINNQIISKSKAFTIGEAREKIQRGGGVKSITENYKCHVNETREIHPESKLFLCSLLPIQSNWNIRDDIAQINAYLKNISEFADSVTYVDVSSAFIQQHGMPELFEEDGLHPSLSGTIKMAATIQEAVSPNVSQRRNTRTGTAREFYRKSKQGFKPAQLDDKIPNNGHPALSKEIE